MDDHSLFRRGLIALLSQDERFAVVGEAGEIGEALRAIQRSVPDLILLDNHLPGVHGVAGIPALKEAAPQARILMLTVSESEDDLAAALQAGADGYLLKTVESDDLSASLLKVLHGEPVVSPAMTAKLVSALRARRPEGPAGGEIGGEAGGDRGGDRGGETAEPGGATGGAAGGASPGAKLAELSARQREILVLIARGHSNKLIARELQIAETTVKIHVQHILRKLGLTSRVQAAAVYASRRA